MSEPETTPLLPEESAREGLDPVTYLEGAFAMITTLGVLEWTGYSLPKEAMVAVGGIGLVIAFVWEYQYE